MARSTHSVGKRLRYHFDNFMSRGGLSVFMALMVLFGVLVLVMTGLRFLVNLFWPDEAYTDFFGMMWTQFLQVSDGGAVAEDTASNPLNRVVGIATMLGGMVVFSSLVAFISSQFEAKMDELRRGKSDVIETGHTLILGFGDRVSEIIRELVVANESEVNPAIVVLSDTPKDEMDQWFRDRLEGTGTTRLITREGSTSNIAYLERVGVRQAKSVIILSQARPGDSDAEKELADARVLKSILAVLSCTGEDQAPNLVAELHEHRKHDLARGILPGRVSVLDGETILGKLMVQTSRVSGLAKVYDTLVGFEGSEFYTHRPAEGWQGLDYGRLQFHYPGCCVLGLVHRDGSLDLNPPADKVVADEDQAILLAEDDSTIVFRASGVSYPTVQGQPSPAAERSREQHLLVGWSVKAEMIIREYLDYMAPGSRIDVLLEAPDPVVFVVLEELRTQFPNYGFTLWEAGFNESLDIGFDPSTYHNILILAEDDGEPEIKDARTLATLLEFRSWFRARGGLAQPQIITEVADSENIQIIEDAGIKDFLISDRFVSKIYAQVSENPMNLRIYQELFGAEGSETYIKPLALYTGEVRRSWTFAELCLLAQHRGETCFGIQLKGLETSKEHNYGIILNPAKSDAFALDPTDCLICLAEDDS